MPEPVAWAFLGIIAMLGLALTRILRRARKVPKGSGIPEDAPVALDLRESPTERLLAELNKALGELRARREAPAPITLAGTRYLRSEVIRLAEAGLDTREIAKRLPVSLAEVDLIVKVHRLCQAGEWEGTIKEVAAKV